VEGMREEAKNDQKNIAGAKLSGITSPGFVQLAPVSQAPILPVQKWSMH